ncbi:MAG: dihydroneopterin aldolase [Candidatus Thalassarchaeum sp.]|nr:dihydroneopterin aldolase [Candidatus Thalassarchaeum sp.]
MAELADALSTLVSQTSGEASIVFLENSVRDVDIGIHDYEKGSTQPVRFDIYVAHSGNPTSKNSGIADVLNYEYLLNALENVVELPRFGLLEQMADELLDSVMLPEPVIAATVKITKTSVPGVEGSLGCCITRFK